MAGGSHRGPVGLTRQRRTIRIVQVILLVIAIGLVIAAITSWGQVGEAPDPRTLARQTSYAQPIVLFILALVAAGAAWLLSDGRAVRIPTPARLEELAGRAENVAIEKAKAEADQS